MTNTKPAPGPQPVQKPIADEIAELRAMSVPELVARYEAAFGKAPRVKHREYLWKRVAWKIQEQRFGGLSVAAQQRLEELIAEIDLPFGDSQRRVTGKLRADRRAAASAGGATYVREWRGREIRATAVEGGYECEGVVYRSLSGIATAVTGTHWNGNLFFGVTRRRKAQ